MERQREDRKISCRLGDFRAHVNSKCPFKEAMAWAVRSWDTGWKGRPWACSSEFSLDRLNYQPNLLCPLGTLSSCTLYSCHSPWGLRDACRAQMSRAQAHGHHVFICILPFCTEKERMCLMCFLNRFLNKHFFLLLVNNIFSTNET